MKESRKEELILVGEYNIELNDILDIYIEKMIIYRSKGLPTHMVKRKHYNCLKYIDYIPEIIKNPDYVGVNPNESTISFELIKKYLDNIMIGIKIDTDGRYLYVSTMHDIQESKVKRRLFSGRLKQISVDKT